MRILIFFVWILTGLTSGVIASDKGHGFGSWIIAGLLLGPFGLIAAAGLSDQKLREYIRRAIDPQFSNPVKTKNNLLKNNDLYINTSPNLLIGGRSDIEDQKRRNIGDFLLHKGASKKQLWTKIIEILEFTNQDLADLADESTSNTFSSISGGKAYIIRDSTDQKIAMAYAKSAKDKEKFHWQIKLY